MTQQFCRDCLNVEGAKEPSATDLMDDLEAGIVDYDEYQELRLQCRFVCSECGSIDTYESDDGRASDESDLD